MATVVDDPAPTKDKVYFTPMIPNQNISAASRQTMLDGATFSRELGFRTVATSSRSSPTYFMRMYTAWRRSSVFLAMYPYFCPPLRSSYKLRSIAAKAIAFTRRRSPHTRAVLYVIDLPIEQMSSRALSAGVLDKKAVATECSVMGQFDYICVFNAKMKELLASRCAMPEDRFIEFEILDYGARKVPPDTKPFLDPRIIVGAGGSARREILGEWVPELPHRQNVRWEFFGRDGEWINGLGRQDLTYNGFVPREAFEDYLCDKAHFGLIDSEGDPRSDEYREYTSTSRFSAYMAAGLPVLVSDRFGYLSHLVDKYRVGIHFKAHDELAETVSNMTQGEYSELREKARELGDKVRSGFFFKRAVTEALSRT